jgi:glycosyltransferase involved in cell wall biosynthesis
VSANRAGGDVHAGGESPFRVLFVVDGLAYNGAVEMAAGIAPRLRTAGADAELFALFPVDASRRVPVDPSVRITQGCSGRLRVRWTFPVAIWRLFRAVRRADVVVAVSEVGFGLLLASAAARVARRPFATMVHADLAQAVAQWVPRRLRRATFAAHRRAGAAICVSETLVAPVVAGGVAPAHVHVVSGGIDVSRVRALALEAPEFPAADVPRIVGLGRQSYEKGFDLLIRAHAAVRAAGVAHELFLIGEGPEHDSLRRLADDLGVGASVRAPGFVDNPFPILAGAAAFVLPSRREGLPLALLQALALGVPVIATRCGLGVEVALGHGRLGTLVEPDSVSALADAMRSPVVDSHRLGAPAADVDRYDLAWTAARLVDVLRPLRRKPAGAESAPRASATTSD